MYSEAVDLVIRAWTEPGPFEHYGKHWKLKYVNPWPRPLQQPHPPIWIPGAGSKETIEYVAAKRWSYMGIPYFHIDFFQRNFDLFRQCAEKNGYTADPEQLGWLLPIYVAETDEQAWAEYEKHLWYFAQNLLKGLTILPPGYTSAQSIAVIGRAKEKFLSNVTTRQASRAGGVRHRRQPGHGARSAEANTSATGRRQFAGSVPTRQPAGRFDEEKHDDVRPGSVAGTAKGFEPRRRRDAETKRKNRTARITPDHLLCVSASQRLVRMH